MLPSGSIWKGSVCSPKSFQGHLPLGASASFKETTLGAVVGVSNAG